MKLKNRLVMPPMVRDYADTQGRVTERYLDHIARVAEGGVGMMILEASFISPEGKGFPNELGVHNDGTVPGLKKLAAVVHKHGAKIGIQLYHAGRQSHQALIGQQTVGPSAITEPLSGETPRALTVPEIKTIIAKYAAAAGRAKKAGLDFVELHGAHGYLITQFLSPFSNNRTDDYGGSKEKRFRFMQEVFLAVRKTVGPKYPIVVRLSGDELVAGGLKIEDTVEISKKLEQLGADALHISVGNYASYVQGMMIPPMAVKEAPLVDLSRKVKQAVKIPVIAVGKLRQPEMAAKVLKNGWADLIAIGRPLLADPDWPKKVRAENLSDLNMCVSCNQGCISRLFANQDVLCTVNPRNGREGLFRKMKKVAGKKAVVVGAGPAGLSAAKVLAERGFKVTVFEEHKTTGGQIFAAAAAPFRGDWLRFYKTLDYQLRRLKVTFKTGVRVTAALIAKEKPVGVIVAIGSSPVRPNIPGLEKSNVVIARDLLEGKAKTRGRVVVAGGGCLGTQTAEFLARRGRAVTIVEATDGVAVDAPIDEKFLLLERLKQLKVQILTKTRIMSVEDKGVVIKEASGRTRLLPAETTVLCLGAKPNDSLPEELKKKKIKVFVAGDAVAPRKITDAAAEGALAALKM